MYAGPVLALMHYINRHFTYLLTLRTQIGQRETRNQYFHFAYINEEIKDNNNNDYNYYHYN